MKDSRAQHPPGRPWPRTALTTLGCPPAKDPWHGHLRLRSSSWLSSSSSCGCMPLMDWKSESTAESLVMLRPRMWLLFMRFTKVVTAFCSAFRNCSWLSSDSPLWNGGCRQSRVLDECGHAPASLPTGAWDGGARLHASLEHSPSAPYGSNPFCRRGRRGPGGGALVQQQALLTMERAQGPMPAASLSKALCSDSQPAQKPQVRPRPHLVVLDCSGIFRSMLGPQSGPRSGPQPGAVSIGRGH